MEAAMQLWSAASWAWRHSSQVAAVGAVTAAVFAGWYTWLTSKILQQGQTPILFSRKFSADFGARAIEIKELENAGKGPAVNICASSTVYRAVQSFGVIAAGATLSIPRLEVHQDAEAAHALYYQDTRGRWYLTDLANHGGTLSQRWRGRRRWWTVPERVRIRGSGETALQFIDKERTRPHRIRKAVASALTRLFRRG
jgi:hypothetical protein